MRDDLALYGIVRVARARLLLEKVAARESDPRSILILIYAGEYLAAIRIHHLPRGAIRHRRDVRPAPAMQSAIDRFKRGLQAILDDRARRITSTGWRRDWHLDVPTKKRCNRSHMLEFALERREKADMLLTSAPANRNSSRTRRLR